MNAAETLGPYRLVGLLGRGAMGEVWLAEEPTAGRRVALKVLRGTLSTRDGSLARFAREVELLTRLDHPRIVRALGPLEQAGDASFFAMELVLGRDLQALLQAQGQLAPDDAGRLVGDVLEALEVAHAAGVVHRDVKPSNVLVDRDGRAHLTDFGLARAADRSRLTASATVLGTPVYMSPEQARGEEAGPASDVYSTGALLFELLAGRPPFEASTPLALLRMHEEATPPDLRALVPGVPAALAEVVARALEKQPERRFVGAGAMREALRAASPARSGVAAAVGSTAALHVRPPDAARPIVPVAGRQGRGRRLALGLALALMLVAAAGLLARSPPHEQPAPVADPGARVRVVLRDGTAVEAWLTGIDVSSGLVSCLERESRAERRIPRAEVLRIEHE